MAVDIVTTLVRTLLADSAVSAVVGTRVFGGEIPLGAVPPLVLVKSVARRPATRPATQWWTSVAAADVHTEDAASSFALATAVEDAVSSISGTQPEGVFSACEATNVVPIEDGGFTPSRHRNVVTVEATARNN